MYDHLIYSHYQNNLFCVDNVGRTCILYKTSFGMKKVKIYWVSDLAIRARPKQEILPNKCVFFPFVVYAVCACVVNFPLNSRLSYIRQYRETSLPRVQTTILWDMFHFIQYSK